jgi:hypothetical protein
MWAAKRNFGEIYLTDTDAIHDPKWYDAIKLLSKVAPLCGVYNTHHHNDWVSDHGTYHITPNIPGISVYMSGESLRRKMGHLSDSKLKDWDFTLPKIFGNKCAVSNVSYVEHLGAGGLHNTGWEDDIALNPTPFLIEERQRIIPFVKKRSWREILEQSQPSVVILNQPHGLGDIIMIEPIARWIESLGHTVLWPYEPAFGNLQKHIDCATMVRRDLLVQNYDSPTPRQPRDTIVLPLRFSQHILGLPYEDCMKSKYMMFDLDWRDWSTAKWKRDTQAEASLLEALDIKPGDKFALINPTFHTTRGGKVSIPAVLGMRNIYLEPVDGFTLIDWSGVIELATEIHSVGTSLQYVVELTDTKAELFMYPRSGESDCKAYDYLFKKPWTQIL